MSATLFALVSLETPRDVEDSTNTVQFNRQSWLGRDNLLTGCYRFYNDSEMMFDNVSQFYAIIHIAKAVPDDNTEIKGPSTNPPDVSTSITTSVSTSNEDESICLVGFVHDICGDIVDLIPLPATVMRHTPTAIFSGVCFDLNKADGSFCITAPQFMTFHRAQNKRASSALTVCTHFDSTQYKNKKPIPNDYMYVTVQGLLTHFDVNNDTLLPTIFHLSVQNIAFLGKAPRPALNPTEPPFSPSRTSWVRPQFSFDFDNPLDTSTSQGDSQLQSKPAVKEECRKRARKE